MSRATAIVALVKLGNQLRLGPIPGTLKKCHTFQSIKFQCFKETRMLVQPANHQEKEVTIYIGPTESIMGINPGG